MNGVRLAGFWRRCGAFGVDAVLAGLVGALADAGGESIATAQGAPVWMGPLWGVLSLAIGAAYWVWPYSTDGQTVGKKLLGIRVVAIDGSRLNWRKGIFRYLGAFVSAFAFLLGYLWCIWDPHKQAWHDKVAGTCVVRDPGRPRAVRLLDPQAARRRQRRWLVGVPSGALVAVALGAAMVWAISLAVEAEEASAVNLVSQTAAFETALGPPA